MNSYFEYGCKSKTVILRGKLRFLVDPGCGECFSRVLQSTTLRGRNHQLDQLQLGTRANYLHKLRSTVTFNKLSGIMVDWTFRGLYKDNGVESDI